MSWMWCRVGEVRRHRRSTRPAVFGALRANPDAIRPKSGTVTTATHTHTHASADTHCLPGRADFVHKNMRDMTGPCHVRGLTGRRIWDVSGVCHRTRGNTWKVSVSYLSHMSWQSGNQRLAVGWGRRHTWHPERPAQ